MLTFSLNFMMDQSWERFLGHYWFILFFEIPRYFIGGIFLAPPYYFYRKNKKNAPVFFEKKPEITALVPCHNEASSLLKTVASLKEQMGVNLKIIVINDGSSDNTHFLCRQLLDQKSIDGYIHIESRGGKASAINMGLQQVKTPLVLVTDSDTTFDRDALWVACEHFKDPAVGAVSGNLRIRRDNGIVTKLQQINYSFSILLGRLVKNALGFYLVASGAFSVFRLEAIKQVGFWEFGPGEDSDISTRLPLAKWKVRFSPFAIAMTEGPPTFLRLAKQRLRWDRSLIRLKWRKYAWPVLNPWSQRFHPAFALGFLDIYVFQMLVPFLFIFYVIQTVVYYGQFAIGILFSVQLFYMVADYLKMGIALLISTRPTDDRALLWYIPLYSLVNIYFLRMVRLYAFCNELIFRGSYTDTYVPEKVRKAVPRY